MSPLEISKTEFKAHALEHLRNIEQSGKPLIITDRGTPKLEIRKLRRENLSPLQILKDSVIQYTDATLPITVDDWENA